jgi:UDP-N-acetylglucosamine--N-acetylmuramyl-(pentapeptide) pyrophosphoryl-undecaprenol N-acetylglucosamine transferase
VAKELKQLNPQAKLIYIGQTGDKLGDIPAADSSIDKVYTVRAGKFRRYHGEGLRQFLDIPTLLKNIRDFFYVLVGLFQSRKLLKEIQPDVIFVKGGFVGVPIGLAAAWLKIPYITHDSDAIPGLANRIISRWAKIHAVALPADIYNYPADKTVSTGIPLQDDFVPVLDKLKQQYRQELKIPASAKLLFIIGGGLGSQKINDAVVDAVPHLLREYRELYVIHAAGRANKSDVSQAYAKVLTEAEQGRLQTFDYIKDVYRYSGAADIVITRAGATNLAEFALQGKACVVVPSPFLAGGHQLKNARYLEENRAAAVISESELVADPHRLAKQVSELLKDNELRNNLATGLSQFAKPNATKELAKLILELPEK